MARRECHIGDPASIPRPRRPIRFLVPDRPLITPFRQRFERASSLELASQLQECVDYLENPQVLIAEFLESYYLVESKLDPEQEDESLEALGEEVVLEPFFDSLELMVRAGSRVERVRCLTGAFAPLAGEVHPALERQGVDFVGLREGSERIVLGVSDPNGDSSSFALLLRGLNCLAELAPPFQLTRLRRHVLRERLDPDGCFDLLLGIGGVDKEPDALSLMLLTRDLAEVFKRAMEAEGQFSGTVGRIDCVSLDGVTPGSEAPLKVRWRV